MNHAILYVGDASFSFYGPSLNMYGGDVHGGDAVHAHRRRGDVQKRKDMVAVNWIIKSSERCEHHKGLVDGRLSQESDNTYRESRPASVWWSNTAHWHWGS